MFCINLLHYIYSNTGLRTPKYMFNTSVSNELGRASSHESEVESLSHSDDEEVMDTGEDEEFANDGKHSCV